MFVKAMFFYSQIPNRPRPNKSKASKQIPSKKGQAKGKGVCLNGSHNAEVQTLLILLSYLSLPQILEVARSRNHVPNSESSSDDNVSFYEAVAVAPLPHARPCHLRILLLILPLQSHLSIDRGPMKQ